MAKRQPGECQVLLERVRDGRELPTDLQAKVVAVRQHFAALRDLVPAFESAKEQAFALGCKVAKATIAAHGAMGEAEDAFREFLLSESDAQLVRPPRHHMAFDALGINPATGEPRK